MLDTAGGASRCRSIHAAGGSWASRWAERSPLHALRLLHTGSTWARAAAPSSGSWASARASGRDGLYLWWPLIKRPRMGIHRRWARPWPGDGPRPAQGAGPVSLIFHCHTAATGALLGMAALSPGLSMRDRRLRPRLRRSNASRRGAGGRKSRASHAWRPASPAFRFLPGPVVAVTMRAPGELDPHGASLVVVDATTGRVVTLRDSRLRP